ncbi:MAG: AAA family ATPase [Scytonematopsis contorta HA4267-MV1]|jgi:PAS domain S-box-containing protein|nr:AAA family ATPase [Scytonematopsis contorta HA4267-MV1]
MLVISDILVTSKIYESSNSLVYRGIRKKDNQPVVIKILNAAYPTPELLSRYKQEFDITHNLELTGVIKPYSLEKYQNTLVIVFEDFGGESLKILMSERRFTIEEFLRIAIKISAALGQIHGANIIHKDINPSNIVFNRATQELKIIDFGISSILSRENPIICNPNILEGTLAYISPEQTGRMNRIVDYRTDFYSLGVTFYELLTHKLPFNASDAMELVYSHIAKQPISLEKLNSDIHRKLAEVVIKLLAKSADDRYKSAYGIQKDLEKILTNLNSIINLDNITLGEFDIDGKLNISQKLYSREKEIQTLISAFNRIACPEEIPAKATDKTQSQIEMILVSGYSGIGKTALVREIYPVITNSKGYFISGKFDQLQRHIPYSSLITALQSLIQQLLTESAEKIAEWREKILAALGQQGKIIIDVIHELELIIGKQPDVSELEPTESQNRFNILFQNFISVFIQNKQPLVIFLDDLQWVDSASLKLIKLLMTNTSEGLLLIGAYRDNEVSIAHPLMLTIDEIKQFGTTINHICLTPLDLNDVTQLIADTLNCTIDKAKLLGELVSEKTAGNPFFINEFLKSLDTRKLLQFDLHRGEWNWDLKKIKGAAITDNVVELMSSKIQTLPESTQKLLKLAACIGHQFDLNTLSIVYEKSLLSTASELWEGVQLGLIMPIGNAYKLLAVVEFSDKLKIIYQFSHDRVQQAAYALISEDTKHSVHWQIGQLILKNTPKATLEEKIFDIVNQLNAGIGSITNSCFSDVVLQEKKDELANFNLIASKKAKTSAANQLAFSYLQVGIGLLSRDSWEKQYNLSLRLYEEAAEVAYLQANFKQMEEFIDIVTQKVTNILDKVKVFEVKILAYIAQSRCVEALDIGLKTLELLGFKLPRKLHKLDVLFLLLRSKLMLNRQPIASLIDLPEMSHPQYKAAMRILNKIISPTYTVAPSFLLQIVFTQIKLSLKFGNTAESAFAYGSYGFILCGIVGDVKLGHQFGLVALDLLERIDAKEIKAKTVFIVHGLIKHWLEPVQKTLDSLRETYVLGLSTGDLEYAVYSSLFYCFQAFLAGKELKQLKLEMEGHSEVMLQLGQERSLSMHKPFYHAIVNLINDGTNPHCFIDAADEKEIKFINHQDTTERAAIYNTYFVQLMLCYLFGDYTQAIASAKLAEQYIDSSTSSPVIPNFYFYDSLARLALVINNPKLQSKQSKQFIQKVQSNQKKMRRWSDYAPDNYLHKFYLVEAELLRTINNDTEAIDYYNKAIKLAKKNEYLHEEALAHELTAKFYLSRGHDSEIVAQAYMSKAYYCYRQWGARSKLKDLESKYPNLLSIKIEEKKINIFDTNTANTESSQLLDITTVVRASQAISGEIMLDKLLANLLKIVMENAGAQKGYLITSNNQELFIELAITAEPNWQVVRQYIPVQNSQIVSASLINYAVITQEIIVINDAQHDEHFRYDFYINNHEVKSALCIPIISHNCLISIIYLENNLTSGAFTKDRLEILRLLSYQASISLENARLYEKLESYSHNLEQEVKKRTGELQIKNEQLKKSERQFQNMAENVPGVIYRYVLHADSSDEFIYVSSSCQEIFEVTPLDFRQQTKAIWGMVHQDDLLSLKNSLANSAKNLTPISWEGRIITSSGKLKWIQNMSRPELQVNGDIIWDGVVVDISDRKQAEVEIITALVKEKELAELRSRFISMTSHEFHTPLNIINTSAQLLERYEWSREEQLEQLQSIRQGVKQMTQLIDGILNTARNDIAKLQFNPVRLELIELCRNIITEIQFGASNLYEIVFSHEIINSDNQSDSQSTNMTECIVYVDLILIKLIINNLLSNAIKYSPQGSKLQLSVNRFVNCIIIEVQDYGIGIPLKDQAQIFTQFYRASNVGSIPGTGSGLAIVKKCADLHSATVTVFSKVGVGTSFKVTLPL